MKEQTKAMVVAEPRNELEHMLRGAEADLAKTLPAMIPAERMIRLALTTLRKKDKYGRPSKLLECSPASFFGALVQAFQLGLEVDSPLGHAYLVPYKGECTFIIGYKGLVDLGYRSGKVKSVSAHVVFDNDEHFKVEYGTNEIIEHRPATGGERGERIGAYAVIRTHDGGIIQRFLPLREIEAARPPHWKKTPWNSDNLYAQDEMYAKTPLRRAAKLAPMSAEMQTAIGIDESSSRGALLSASITGGVLDVSAGVEIVEPRLEAPSPEGHHARKPQTSTPPPETPPEAATGQEPAEGDGSGDIPDAIPESSGPTASVLFMDLTDLAEKGPWADVVELKKAMVEAKPQFPNRRTMEAYSAEELQQMIDWAEEAGQ